MGREGEEHRRKNKKEEKNTVYISGTPEGYQGDLTLWVFLFPENLRAKMAGGEGGCIVEACSVCWLLLCFLFLEDGVQYRSIHTVYPSTRKIKSNERIPGKIGLEECDPEKGGWGGGGEGILPKRATFFLPCTR